MIYTSTSHYYSNHYIPWTAPWNPPENHHDISINPRENPREIGPNSCLMLPGLQGKIMENPNLQWTIPICCGQVRWILMFFLFSQLESNPHQSMIGSTPHQEQKTICFSHLPVITHRIQSYGRLMLTKLGYITMVNGKPLIWHTYGSVMGKSFITPLIQGGAPVR